MFNLMPEQLSKVFKFGGKGKGWELNTQIRGSIF